MTQKLPRYEMHKYWGKKPPAKLQSLIAQYTHEHDVVLDPFSGYGVFIGEAYINNRNVVSNDLNPVATFIQHQLLSSQIDISKLEKLSQALIEDTLEENKKWYGYKCPKCGELGNALTTLRTKDNQPIKCKIKCSCSRSAIEHILDKEKIDDLLTKEKLATIPDHPVSKILRNGRISAFNGLITDDLFTIRSLVCHISLYNKIRAIEEQAYRELLLLAFTSNLANCSRLVPPIKSRGDMAPGAWMTGFYVGETYLENNVFHYFKNRVSKLINGKKDFLQALSSKNNAVIGEISSLSEISNNGISYFISNYDAKKLPYPDNSIDYVFTDPPYGDSVPYFEQSVVWNTWLGFLVDYENEVVVSDSKERSKTIDKFATDIQQCINEIYRVLKPEKYFTLTFHSISGEEWFAILNGCLKNNFSLHKVEWLTQKTFTPRQLNRTKTVKGDMLITFIKSEKNIEHQVLNYEETLELIVNITKVVLSKKKCTNTNDIYIKLLNEFFSKHIIIAKVNIIELLSENFNLDDEGNWSM